MRFILLALCAALIGGNATAQGFSWFKRGPASAQWEAVGRLEIGGEAFCTGALIAPDLVLTAAHCLFDPGSGARVPDSSIQFLAGWRKGRAAVYRRVSLALPHPDYRYGAPTGPERVRNDLAVIRLQHPIQAARIKPFATGDWPEEGGHVGVVSYAHDRNKAPTFEETCTVMARRAGMLVLSCPVDFGASGSPVFSFGADGAARIVSVISAKAEADGTPVALATDLRAPFADLMRMVRPEIALVPPDVRPDPVPYARP